MQGAFDEYGEWIVETYNIEVSEEDVRKFLKSYGAWDAEDLKDYDVNLLRLVWIATLNCKENETTYFYMGE
jgi:hypothetical protein